MNWRKPKLHSMNQKLKKIDELRETQPRLKNDPSMPDILKVALSQMF